jgi:glycosyltransferase involved in cell wall biosynthesis
MDKKSIIYVNYSPYENSGHILDYLLENFDSVYLFSLAFHTLGSKSQNKFTIYKKGKFYSEEYLFYMDIPESFVFLFIPIRSILNALQIIKKILEIKKDYGRVDIFFSVNAFTATIGIIFEKFHLVNKTVFWVWDYYPMQHKSIIVRVMRWLYWQFDKFAMKSDRTIFLNERLLNVRKQSGLLPKSAKFSYVPIGTGKNLPKKVKEIKIIKVGFIGVLKVSQGLDFIFDAGIALSKKFPGIVFEIIGSGPDEKYFQDRAKTSAIAIKFHGLVDEKEFKEILYNCTLGIAPYVPDKSNVSVYGDPGKVKRYLEFNLPTIITNVFEFSKVLESTKAGVVIRYGDTKGLVLAIEEIIKNYEQYTKNAMKLHEKYYYKNIYPTIFGISK